MAMISPLSGDILQRTLPFLSQDDAVRTCVLSKSWRYLWYTRPNIEFRDVIFKGNKKRFLSFVDKTLQRYHDQNLSIHEFRLEMLNAEPKSILLLSKWIPILVMPNMGVKKFHLYFYWAHSAYFALPSIVFQSESLQELYLERCQIKHTDNIHLKHLNTLFLKRVNINQETLAVILSSCSLIKNVSLLGCKGFKTIKVYKPSGLRYLTINGFNSSCKKMVDLITIQVRVPIIKTIRITGCRLLHHHNYFLPFLNCLSLTSVELSNKSFDFCSGNYLPSLEHLALDSCYGFQELQLYLSGSVKHLSIMNIRNEEVKKAVIDAPNIATFCFEGEIPQSTISFTTTSREWKSNIILKSVPVLDDHVSSWWRKLHCLLKVLSQSQISLELFQPHAKVTPVFFRLGLDCSILGPRYKPLVVEHLSLRGCYSFSRLPDFLECLFRICRPRYMVQHLYSTNIETNDIWEREDKKLNESILEILLRRHYFWPKDLKEVSLEGFEDNGQKRHPFKGVKVSFRLKWR